MLSNKRSDIATIDKLTAIKASFFDVKVTLCNNRNTHAGTRYSYHIRSQYLIAKPQASLSDIPALKSL